MRAWIAWDVCAWGFAWAGTSRPNFLGSKGGEQVAEIVWARARHVCRDIESQPDSGTLRPFALEVDGEQSSAGQVGRSCDSPYGRWPRG